MFKNVSLGKEGREKVKIGIDTIANAVRITLGAAGRNVLLGNGYGPVRTSKDGYTVAQSISLVEPIEQMGCVLIQEVAAKTVSEAGDQTTTSMILAQDIIDAGLKAIDEGANPVELKKGIEKATQEVIAKLKELSRDIDDQETLIQIATISANNDSEIGNLIANAFNDVGKEGKIDVSDSKTHETYVDIVNGMKIDRGWQHPVFINHPKGKRICELENPLILVSDRKVSTMKELLPFFEKVLNVKPTRPLLLILDRLEGEAGSLIYKNRHERKLDVTVILAPEYNDDRQRALEDIACLVGGKFISDVNGDSIEKALLKDCGTAERVIIDEHSTLFVNGGGDALSVNERCEMLRQQIEETGSEKAKERLAKLIGKIASIKVGGVTQTEAEEKKYRIDDALCATRAANEEGYVAGGGTAFLHCLPKGEMVITNRGEAIVYEAIQQPFKQILLNAGKDEVEIRTSLDLCADYGFGQNVKTDNFEDLFKAGVIDPTKCLRCALENASSIAALFLTTECVVSDPKPKEYLK